MKRGQNQDYGTDNEFGDKKKIFVQNDYMTEDEKTVQINTRKSKKRLME